MLNIILQTDIVLNDFIEIAIVMGRDRKPKLLMVLPKNLSVICHNNLAQAAYHPFQIIQFCIKIVFEMKNPSFIT